MTTLNMVSCVHRLLKIQAGLSGHSNKSFECVSIADNRFSDRVVVRKKIKEKEKMFTNDAKEPTHKLGNNIT